MSKSCNNPTCTERAWWSGWCRICFQTTGVAERLAEERTLEEQRDKAERIATAKRAVNDSVVELGDHGTAPWWEISEKLNAQGHRLGGRPFTPTTARGRYLELTAHQWE